MSIRGNGPSSWYVWTRGPPSFPICLISTKGSGIEALAKLDNGQCSLGDRRVFSVTLSASEGSLGAVLSISEGFFAEFTLSEILRSLRFLRMTRSEGLRDDKGCW
jgi:hypothetical protein